MIYLDNAATSWPKPESVYQTMDSFLREKGANPGRSGHTMAVAAAAVIEETRTLVARLLNASDATEIVFTLNCTDALNLALKGLLRPGDHIISDSIGHNSLVRPLRRLESEGVLVTRLPPSAEGTLLPQQVEEAIRRETRAIAVTHASNVSGIIQPLDGLAEVARRHRLAFVVDAAQTAGILPIDVQAADLALVALSGHKGTYGPPGTGCLYVRKDLDLQPLREGGTGVFSESEEQPLGRPHRYESGTANSVGIAGLGAGLRYVLAEGVERILSHERALTVRLLEGLLAIEGVTVYGPLEIERRVGVVSLRLAGWTPGEAGAILDQAFDVKVRTGLHCAPAAHKALGTFPLGAVRASVSRFNTLDEIGFFLEAIAEIASAPAPSLASAGVETPR